jgi:signal transduction histidine kinase
LADLFAALERRQKALITAFTALILLTVGALQVVRVWVARDEALAEGRSQAGQTAHVLAQYVSNSFRTADAALRSLAVHGEQMGGTRASTSAWTSMLLSAQSAMAGAPSISVADAAGIIRFSTLPAIVGESRADQFIFRQLVATRRNALIIDTPYFVKSPPAHYIIPIGRPLLTSTGRLEGVIVTTIEPDSYSTFIKDLDVGDGGVVSLLHPEGFVLVREPSSTNPLGQSAANDPLLRAALSPESSGTFDAPLREGGEPYVNAFEKIAEPVLVVGVSRPQGEILAAWRQEAWSTLGGFAVWAATLGAILLVTFRQMNARTRIEQALAEAQRQESEHLREANERLEAALEREQRARQETEAASLLKDEFLMTVSHELRTPLTAIYGWVRMLSTGAVPSDQQARALAAVERNASAQTRLIDDLLDVSRAIAGKLRIEARRVDVSEVVNAAIETVRPALKAKGIDFSCFFARSIDPISADPDRLQQIVWNLLSNAIKFTPDGGSIALRVDRVDGAVQITVSDTGAGIPAEFLPYVFDRFRQAEGGSRRRYGGLGLGLAIVRALAELHGGSVQAESAGPGAGATFRVRLPMTSAPAYGPADSAPQAARLPRPAPARLDGIRVLIVDDDPDALELLGSILTGAGAVVLCASSAAEAMDIIARETDVVLVSDIEMPGEDGYQLLERARRELAARGVRLVALAVTAYARAVDRRRALDAGFDAHVPKPVEPAYLVGLIASLLDVQQVSR